MITKHGLPDRSSSVEDPTGPISPMCMVRFLNGSMNQKKAGKQWAVACDEPGDATQSLLPDEEDPDHDNARIKRALGERFWPVDGVPSGTLATSMPTAT